MPRPAFPGLAFAPGPRPPAVSGGKRWPGLVFPGHKARPGHIERTERVPLWPLLFSAGSAGSLGPPPRPSAIRCAWDIPLLSGHTLEAQAHSVRGEFPSRSPLRGAVPPAVPIRVPPAGATPCGVFHTPQAVSASALCVPRFPPSPGCVAGSHSPPGSLV